MSAHPESKMTCELSVVIKALNEEKNIERTLRSVLAATAGLDAEIILADSLSSDGTVEIAKRFPVTVVQLVNSSERCCGIGAQLGYQYARGQYILVMDGDMEVEREWLLEAIKRLNMNAALGGVGGLVDDVNLDNIEFRARQQRKPPDMQVGSVDRLNMGGLYRKSAIKQIGYLTHRSLHACEELELGLRLLQGGWKLERLRNTSIHHYGHTVPMWTLVKRRWRSRYVNGSGELVRSSVGKPWFLQALKCFKLSVAVVGWWASILALFALAMLTQPYWWVALAFITLLPVVIMVIRKQSIPMGLYSVMSWCVDAAGFIRGLLTSPHDPEANISSRVLQDGKR